MKNFKKKIKNTSLKKVIEDSIIAKKSLFFIEDKVDSAISKIFKKVQKGGKIFLCGNGGSAADAQHLAAEFLVRLRPEINRKPIPAVSLSTDISTITACGNDYEFDDIFLRPFKALAMKDDVLICISTSGNSRNILKVLKESKKKEIYSVCFLGKGGGEAKKFSQTSLIVNSNNTARIQECHIFLGHFILEKVEDLIMFRN